MLDLTGSVSTGGEQGLLGLAFSPDGGRLYVNYTDPAGDTRIVEYAFADGRADPGSARELLIVDQPFANHNGGNLVFGPDGMLWIGLGDGGGGNDPQGNAQSLGTLLGKMLRIDPRPSGGRPYTVPPDNPFVGTDGARGEIWAFGLRNPWRYSFDKATGDLWIGDVGQNAREEVDFTPAGSPGGLNYGWPGLEGNRSNSGSAPSGAVAPDPRLPARRGQLRRHRRLRLPGHEDPRPGRRLPLRRRLRRLGAGGPPGGGQGRRPGRARPAGAAAGLLRPGRRRRAVRPLARRRRLPHRPRLTPTELVTRERRGAPLSVTSSVSRADPTELVTENGVVRRCVSPVRSGCLTGWRWR